MEVWIFLIFLHLASSQEVTEKPDFDMAFRCYHCNGTYDQCHNQLITVRCGGTKFCMVIISNKFCLAYPFSSFYFGLLRSNKTIPMSFNHVSIQRNVPVIIEMIILMNSIIQRLNNYTPSHLVAQMTIAIVWIFSVMQ